MAADASRKLFGTDGVRGVANVDPVTFAAMVALFLAIAVVATWMPARRAAALDPSIALRDG